MKTRLSTTAAFLAALLSGAAAQAEDGPNNNEYIQAYGGQLDIFMVDDRDNSSYVTLNDYSTDTFCFSAFPPSDLLQSEGNASSASADLTSLLGELQCSGPAPSSFTIDCSSDGVMQQHSIGSHTSVYNGQRSSYHGANSYQSATCTAVLNGTSYQLNGTIQHGVNRSKQP